MPASVEESYAMAMEAFDLAEQFQTPVFVMMDLDLGMNNWMSEAFTYPTKPINRGKRLTPEIVKTLGEWGRYKDVDGDGIPWRTLPGTHPTKGAFFTRGRTRDPYARYSEKGADYIYNMDRLQRKFQTAAELVPQPVLRQAAQPTHVGVLYFGSTSPAMGEALDVLADEDVHIDAMRLRAFPFPQSVPDFIAAHDKVFVVEQNRDAQMHSMLVNELDIAPSRLVRVLHYDGTPINARFIARRSARAWSGKR